MAIRSEDSVEIEYCPSFHHYRSRRFRPVGPDRDKLRAAYGGRYGKYVRSYQKNDENFISLQESCMQSFVKMERKLLRWMRIDQYNTAGAKAMKSLGTALSSDVSGVNHPNIALVSLDFEYAAKWDSNRSVYEIGFATLHSNHLLSESDATISASHFILRNVGKRKFMFGESA